MFMSLALRELTKHHALWGARNMMDAVFIHLFCDVHPGSPRRNKEKSLWWSMFSGFSILPIRRVWSKFLNGPPGLDHPWCLNPIIFQGRAVNLPGFIRGHEPMVDSCDSLCGFGPREQNPVEKMYTCWNLTNGYPDTNKSHRFVCFHVDESRSKVPSNFAICDVHQGEDGRVDTGGPMDEIPCSISGV